MRKGIFHLAVIFLFGFISCKKTPVEDLAYVQTTTIDTTPKTTTVKLTYDSSQSFCFRKNETLHIVVPIVSKDSTVSVTFQLISLTVLPVQISPDSSFDINKEGNIQFRLAVDSMFTDTLLVIDYITYDTFLNPIDTFWKDSIVTDTKSYSLLYAIIFTKCPPDSASATNEIYVPSSFSPDGDGVNDTWFVSGGPVQEIKIEIRDNNGSVVFNSNTIDKEWDGKYSGNSVPEGYYLYYIEYTDMSGNKKTLNDRLELFRY